MNRRKFLSQVACAFAVAAVPCTIPREAYDDGVLNEKALTDWYEVEITPFRGKFVLVPMRIPAGGLESELGVALTSVSHP